MFIGTPRSLAALAWAVSRKPSVLEELFQRAHAIATQSEQKRTSNKKLAKAIDTLATLADDDYALRASVNHLINAAVVQKHRRFTLEQYLSWFAHLVDWDQFQELERHVQSLRHKKDMHVPASQVIAWAELASMRLDHKSVALLVLNGECWSFRHIPTPTLCYWLECSAMRYDGNHGILRLLRMLVSRANRIRPGTRMLEQATEILAYALWEARRESFIYDILTDTVKKHSVPRVSREVFKLLRAYHKEELKQVRARLAACTENRS